MPLNDGYIMVTDPDGTATIDYGVGGLPITFFLDTEGKVKRAGRASSTWELLDVKDCGDSRVRRERLSTSWKR